MANVQVENGATKIAFDFQVALCRTDFSGLERRILDTIMLLTWGRQQTKAEIAVNDIQSLVGLKIRPNRITAALDGLVAKGVVWRQKVSQQQQILGIQKDFDKWGRADSETADQPSAYIYNGLSNINNLKTLTSVNGWFTYTLSALKLKLTVKGQQVEYGAARALWATALKRTLSPEDTYYALKDYVDYLCQDDWFRTKTKFPFTWMSSRFERWYGSIPKKTWDIREQEKAIGYRHTYNFKAKRWAPSAERLNQ